MRKNLFGEESEMKKIQSGFTLIELMIVVATIGILAAIALPAYQNYTKRSHVSEGLSLASGVKSAVAEYYSAKGVWPQYNNDAGLDAGASITGNSVDKVHITNGIVTIVFNEKVQDNKRLELSPVVDSGSIEWVCQPSSIYNPIDEKYLPARCRH